MIVSTTTLMLQKLSTKTERHFKDFFITLMFSDIAQNNFF